MRAFQALACTEDSALFYILAMHATFHAKLTILLYVTALAMSHRLLELSHSSSMKAGLLSYGPSCRQDGCVAALQEEQRKVSEAYARFQHFAIPAQLRTLHLNGEQLPSVEQAVWYDTSPI